MVNVDLLIREKQKWEDRDKWPILWIALAYKLKIIVS